MEPSTSGTSSTTVFLPRRSLYEIMENSGCSQLQEKFRFLREELRERNKVGPENMKEFNERINKFCFDFKTRWYASARKQQYFLQSNRDWLDSSISFSCCKKNKRGRMEVPFEECSEPTKRKKSTALRKTAPLPLLVHATQMGLKAAGQLDASKVMQEISESPAKATKYRLSFQTSEKKKQMSKEEALSVLVEAKLSRDQYNIISQSAPEQFPCYTYVQFAKKDCYPKRECIKIDETSVEVSLQGLLDHTVERIMLSQKSVFEILDEENLYELCLYSKWGFDGSSGQSFYKQAFHGTNASDSSVFITCVVPLRLVYKTKIIWMNPRPSSTRYCRPLKMEFVKESAEVSKTEKARVDEEIRNLANSIVFIDNKRLEVRHNLMLTMVDGKVCNALTDTKSTQSCYLCGATSKQFNDIDNMIKREVNMNNIQFGLSILHGWIRFFECLLHVSYKLPIKKWQARSLDEKKIVSENKARIQKEFRDRIGLIVDQPKPGYGSTNDGNTARRFFENAEVSSEITKIDIELITKMHMLMIAVSSGHEIEVEKFRQFALSTARLFVQKYPWYYMPPTLHKYLIHGPEIVSHALLPIGQLSEEAKKARNKDFKRYREDFARKCSRQKANEDIFNRFLITSDPLICSKRKLPKKKFQTLPKAAVELLKPAKEDNDGNDNIIDNDDYEHKEEDDDDDDDDVFANDSMSDD